MKKIFTVIVSMLMLAHLNGFAQQIDTVIDGRHYNTVIKYHHFDYKGEKEASFITAYGNMNDSVKMGRWMYVLPDGTVLAVGKFKDGYKTGDWKYRDSDGSYFIHAWRRTDKIKDYVSFYDNTYPYLVDYSGSYGIALRCNGIGHRIPNPSDCIRWL